MTDDHGSNRGSFDSGRITEVNLGLASCWPAGGQCGRPPAKRAGRSNTHKVRGGLCDWGKRSNSELLTS